MMKYGRVLISLLVLGIPGYGDTPPLPNIRVTTNTADGRPGKAAWEWTDEERIKVRFDRTGVRERLAAGEALAKQSAQGKVESSPQFRTAHQNVIDGSRDPALFLPVELLDVLLEGLSSDGSFRNAARAALAKDILEMGYTEDVFWKKLEQISAPYRALLSKPRNVTVQRVKTPDGSATSFPIDIDRCVARNNLLQSARTTFGAQKFQRFLYTAVAPEIVRVVETQQEDPAQEILFIARGCHQ
jgi:hypothetical protein